MTSFSFFLLVIIKTMWIFSAKLILTFIEIETRLYRVIHFHNTTLIIIIYVYIKKYLIILTLDWGFY